MRMIFTVINPALLIQIAKITQWAHNNSLHSSNVKEDGNFTHKSPHFFKNDLHKIVCQINMRSSHLNLSFSFLREIASFKRCCISSKKRVVATHGVLLSAATGFVNKFRVSPIFSNSLQYPAKKIVEIIYIHALLHEWQLFSGFS